MESEWRLNILDLGFAHYSPGFFGQVSLIARLADPIGPYLYLAGVVTGDRVWLLQDISPDGVFAPFDEGVPPANHPHFPYGFSVIGN